MEITGRLTADAIVKTLDKQYGFIDLKVRKAIFIRARAI
jgi:hypothetical protein